MTVESEGLREALVNFDVSPNALIKRYHEIIHNSLYNYEYYIKNVS